MINLLMPLFFIVFGCFIICTALEMNTEEGTFPLMIGGVTLIVALFQFVKDIQAKKSRSNFISCNLLKVIEVIFSLMLYIFFLNKVGYVIDTVVLASYIMLTLGYKKYRLIFLSATIIVGAAFTIFKLFLRVPLPMLFIVS